MTSDKAFWLFAFFAIVVFLMGGGSRHDYTSVGPLRFIAAIVLAIGIYFQTAQSFKRVAGPVILLLLLATLMAMQLIPLPPSWWSSLPGRETIVETGELIGLSDVWRPLTFSPLKTANSLASLVVPIAAFLLLALLEDAGWARVRKLIIFTGLASALLGLAQVIVSGAPGLYFYDITSNGSAVGLFANRNHNALFLNIALLFSLFENWRTTSRKSAGSQLTLVAIQIVLLLAILINGSRFGLALLALIALVFAVQLLVSRRTNKPARKAIRSQNMAAVLVSALSLGLIGLFVGMSRIPAIDRFFTQSLDEGQRAETLPYILSLLTDHFPYGVGFGAFEQAYRTIEPAEFLGPAYLNHAHNDWLQIAIEGGAIAVGLLAVALILLMRRVIWLWGARRGKEPFPPAPWLGLLALLMIGSHSLVDYPLRVPSIMLVCAICVGMVFRSPTAQRE